ncbi:hypothetical protein BK129_11485 [Paenibacillus amylolyticus]|nr:hypothetical protein BK129_11485 [Paenibacillus amylolyticus]
MWAYIKGLLEQNMSNYMNDESAVLQLPDDDVLTSQLTTRKWSMTRKNAVKSPDRADAYVLTFSEYLTEALSVYNASDHSWIVIKKIKFFGSLSRVL